MQQSLASAEHVDQIHERRHEDRRAPWLFLRYAVSNHSSGLRHLFSFRNCFISSRVIRLGSTMHFAISISIAYSR